MLADPQTLLLLQQRTRFIRNICILAHVDHGKTTLSDSLLSSNGIISPRLAGKVRFLDSLPDEQARGITMKSSSIALLFKKPRSLVDPPPSADAAAGATSTGGAAPSRPSAPAPAPAASDLFLINLIDCPGHVDFSSEVSNAVRVSDGCLVLVDVLEGICVQTHAVLRAAWDGGLKPVLVLNKVDRLILELRMEPLQAFQHIQKIIEGVNAIVATFLAADAMALAAKDGRSGEEGSALVDIDDDAGWRFDPVTPGNVVFASAFDCWAFTVGQFADMWAGKMGVQASKLLPGMWGENYWNAKDQTISDKPPKAKSGSAPKAPMCVELILKPLFSLYQSVHSNNAAKTAEIVKFLGIDVPASAVTTSKDPQLKLSTILSKWLPIPTAILGAVAEQLPSPIDAQATRMEKFWTGVNPSADKSLLTALSDTDARDRVAMADAVRRCDKDHEHVLIYVSKMVDMGEMIRKMKEAQAAAAVSKANSVGVVRGAYQRGKFAGGAAATAAPAEPAAAPVAAPAAASASPVGDDTSASAASVDDESSRFVGLARIWCGTLRADPSAPTTLHIFGPKYDPLDPATHAAHKQSVTFGGGQGAQSQGDEQSYKLALYLLMGSDIQPMSSVPAGNVFALGGLGSVLHNTGTLSTLGSALPFAGMKYQSAPIVRVALETEQVGDMKLLLRGLRLLNQADANVLVQLLDSGEHVVVASGELHLERCIRDLRERFCPPGIKIRVSPPLISFRETVAEEQGVDSDKTVKSKLAAAAAAASGGAAGASSASAAGGGAGGNKKKQNRDERKREDELAQADIEAARKVKEARKVREVAAAAERAAAGGAAASGSHLKPSGSNDDLSASTSTLSIGGDLPASSIRSGSEIDPSSSVAHGAGAGVPKLAKYKFVVEEVTPNKQLTLWVQAIPLPNEVTQALEGAQAALKALVAKNAAGGAGVTSATAAASSPAAADGATDSSSTSDSSSGPGSVSDLPALLSLIRKSFSSPASSHLFTPEDVARIWTCGPRSIGPNVLINRVEEFAHLTSMWPKDMREAAAATAASSSPSSPPPSGSPTLLASPRSTDGSQLTDRESLFLSYSNALLSGFQLACQAGPLCEEPLMGVAFALEKFEINDAPAAGAPAGAASGVSRNTGLALGAMRNACRSAFQARSPRLMEAMYRVQLQCETEALGALYGVISRRRGRIVGEELREGTSVFVVEAYLPVAESFGFAGDVRKKTGGEASPQLLFSHWELIPQDPFFVPRTEEELEFHGALDATPNLARDLVDHVRRRKGLAVQEKVVQHAEKQRTIKH